MAYKRPQYNYVVLDTVQALAADVTVANQQISFGNPLVPVCKWPSLMPGGACYLQASVAEVLQVTTLTPVAAASSTYTFIIQQYDIANGVTLSRMYTMTTAAAGDTATTICNFFRTQINADDTMKVVASGAATLILTAETGYPIFVVTITATGGGLTQATGTAGVRSVNTLADLTREGVDVTGAAYYRWHLEFLNYQGNSNTLGVRQYQIWEAFILTGAANRAALTTRLTEIMNTFASGGAVVDPEILAVA
jgi:hypothetical protein